MDRQTDKCGGDRHHTVKRTIVDGKIYNEQRFSKNLLAQRMAKIFKNFKQ